MPRAQRTQAEGVPGARSTCRAASQPLRVGLRELLPQLTGTVPADNLFGSPLAGAALILASALGALDDKTLTTRIAALLTGSRGELRDAATLISRLCRRELTAALVTLLSDPYPDVRAETAGVLAMRVASPDTGIDPLAIAGLQQALADPGARVSWRSPMGLPPPKRPATRPGSLSLRCSATRRRVSANPQPAQSMADARPCTGKGEMAMLQRLSARTGLVCQRGTLHRWRSSQ